MTGGENIAPMVITRDDNVVGQHGGQRRLAHVDQHVAAERPQVHAAADAWCRPSRACTGATRRPGDNARISFPWTVASVKVWRDYDSGHPIAAAASLAALDASTGNVYFYDAASSTMYVKLVVQATKNYSTIFIDPM